MDPPPGGAADEPADLDRALAGESSAAEGDTHRGSRYGLARCASQSSLDESSQGAGRGAGGGGEEAGAEHAAGLLGGLARLRASGALCDVAVRAEGGPPLAAHRAVLAAASPYFRAMFTAFEERSQPSVTIRGVEPAALASLLDWVYAPSSLTVSAHTVQALLGAASLLALGGVRDQCARWLAAALAPDNALGIRAFATLHSCAELARAAADHVDERFPEVIRGEEFLSLDAAALAAVLDSDRLNAPDEDLVLEAVLDWVKHDPEERERHLGTLLEHVRLPLLARDVLVARAGAAPLAAAGLRVKDLLIEALSYHLAPAPRRAALAAACPRARPRRAGAAPAALLVAGGQAPKAVRDTELLDLTEAAWRGAAPLPTRRCRAGLAAVGGRAYAVGGFNGTLRVRTVDVYDAAEDAWAPGPPLTARRSTLGVAALAGTIYAVGGFDGAAGLATVEALDEGAAAWRPIAAMSTRRSSVGVAALDGRLYAVGGYDGVARQCLHTVERYDPAADAWEPVADMSARRSGCGVGAASGALYAVGGHDGPAVRRSVERYRVGGAWAPAPPMRCARRNAAVAAHGGKLYAVGGDDGAANLASVEVFDPAADAWTLLSASMSLGRSYAGVVVLERAPP